MSGVTVDPGGFDATGAVAILVLGAALVALFAGVPWWWMVLALGWLVLVPLVGMLTDAVSFDGESGSSEEDPLAVLRDRYARDEISEAEFERKVDRLLETEDVEVPTAASDEREPERARE